MCDNYAVTDCSNWRQAKTFFSSLAASIKNATQNDNRVGMILFSSPKYTRVVFDFSQDSNSLESTIMSLQYNQWQETHADLGFNLAHTQFFSSNVENHLQAVIILLVNDVSPEHIAPSVSLASDLQNKGVLILPIGVSTDNKLEDLLPIIQDYASEPKVCPF